MEWYLKVMRDNYANFNGRARRKEYWMFSLFFFIFFFIGLILAIILSSTNDILGGGFGIILIIFFLVHFIPSFAVTIRRFHDTGNSGWLYIVAFIPYIGSLIIFIITLLDSEEKTNKWGPNPKSKTSFNLDKSRK